MGAAGTGMSFESATGPGGVALGRGHGAGRAGRATGERGLALVRCQGGPGPIARKQFS